MPVAHTRVNVVRASLRFCENWHLIRLLIAFLLAAAAASSAKAPADEFARAPGRIASIAGRRRALAQKDSPKLMIGSSAFSRTPDFYYLTGWTEPGAALLMTPSDEILFLPLTMSARERYSGKRTSAEDADAHAVTGFEKVLPIEKLETELDLALGSHARLYAPWSESYAGQLRSRYPFREVADATPLIAKLRVKKSAAEIAAIQHATDVSMEAHRAAWKRLAAGQYEYQVAATLLDTFLDQGCEGPAYSPIVGSGPNGAILHYMSNQRRMDRGELVVIDAAAQCDSYASDITRTVPVGGKFTPRQREIYEIVLGAQKAAIAAVKPGACCLAGPGRIAHQESRAITSTPTEKTCMASRWASISSTTSGIRLAWKCTTRVRRPARSRHGDHHRAGRLYCRRKHSAFASKTWCW